jgi:diguanylate cyclase (GGDEF)-like protein/PAS domain S-box-containing protein
MLPYYPGVSLLILAPGGVISNEVPLPGSEKAIGLDLLSDPVMKKEANLARRTGTLVLAGPLTLAQGGVAVIGRLPVFLDDAQRKHEFWGFTNVVLRFPDALVGSHLPDLERASFSYVLWRNHPDTGEKQVIASSASPLLNDPVEVLLDLPYGNWTLSAAPVNGWGDPVGISFRAALAFGFSLLLAYVVILVMKIRSQRDNLENVVDRRTRELQLTHIELQGREALLQQILDTSSVAIFLADENGRIKRVNKRMAEMFDRSEQSLTDCDYSTLVHPSQREEAQVKVAALVTESTPAIDLDRLYWRTDGSEFWGHLSHRGFFESAQYGRILVCVIIDITLRKMAEVELRESEQRYRTAFVTSPDSVNITRLSDGQYIEVNDGFVKMLGWSREESVGRTSLEMNIWHSHKDRERLVGALQRDGRCENLEATFVAKDGRVMTGLMSAHMMELKGQMCVLSVTRDITERKAAEAQLRKLSQAIEQSSDSVIITNVNAEIEYVNEAFVRNTGFSREEVLGKNPRLLQSGKTPRDTYTAMWEAMVQGRPWSGEFLNQRKDGTEYFESAVISPIRQSDGSITHFVAVKADITTKKVAEERINSLAFFDPLTELPNRRLLLDRLKHAMSASARSEHYGALLYIDLDNFKTLNDTLGHDIGDLLLQQVAQRLVKCVREGDTVARLGGDEFVLLLESLSKDMQEAATGAEAVGEKILDALNQAYQLAGFSCHSTPSIGVTLFAEHQGGVEDLLKRADLAMYTAKDAGRNTLRFFEPEMQAAVTMRAALESDLREAVQSGQFLLFYQAQVDRTGSITGVEALLRWKHPLRDLVPPALFIPLAEDTGLIVPIGHWVLETACTQICAWSLRPEMNHLSIAVNVSARQFYQSDFVEQVLAILSKTGANPMRLKLELTESLLVTNIEDVITKMHHLKAIGVGFSLDDFGTGYSSLSYLKRLPLDQLKIDQSFVKDILTDTNDAAIAKMVIALAGSLGLAVIAEGVETVPQRDFLAVQGCYAYQGYLFSKPIPLREFEEFAARS